MAITDPSLADRLAFDELPEAMRDMIIRLYGFDFRDGEPDDGVAPTVASLRDAYRAGWEECAEEFQQPYFRESAFDRWQKNRARREVAT